MFFLTGGVGLENKVPNPAPSWLSDKAWDEVCRMCDLPGYTGFRKDFQGTYPWGHAWGLGGSYEGLNSLHPPITSPPITSLLQLALKSGRRTTTIESPTELLYQNLGTTS